MSLVINSKTNLAQRNKLHTTPSTYIRAMNDIKTKEIMSLSCEATLSKALMCGVAYYNGGADPYSVEVLKQLSGKPSENPAIVSMESCVGTNFPFSTVYITRNYALATPATIFQAVSRASRLGKNVISGRAIFHPDGQAKLLEFFTEDQSIEARRIEELYNYIADSDDNTDLLDLLDF